MIKLKNNFLSTITTSFSKNSFLFIFLTVIFLINLQTGVILSPDSGTYIDHGIVRIGLYPLTLSLFRYMFGAFGLQALVAFQLVIALWASYSLSTFLKNQFNLPTFFYWGLLCLFLSPVIFAGTGNDILSEALAYPLFLFTSYFFLKGIIHKDINSLKLFCFSLFLLAFTRQQYLFFYCIALVSLGYFFWFQPSFQKKGPYFLALIISFGSLMVSERAYHYVYHDSFSVTAGVASQFVVRPLFVATSESYKDFSDPQQRLIVKKTMDELINNKMIDPDPGKRAIDQFSLLYIPMALVFYNLRPQIWAMEQRDTQENKLKSLSQVKYTQMLDQQTTTIALTLIKKNFMRYIISYIKDVIRGFGGYTFFGITVFLSLICLWNLFGPHSNRYGLYLSFIFSTLINLGNVSVICVMEPPLVRYIYSTHILLCALFLILGFDCLKAPLLSDTKNKSRS